MPSLMVHLEAAKLVHSEAPLNFYIGNVAPDCIRVWEQKERLHLRDREDRGAALAELYERLDMSDPFQEGVTLHLFVDRLWDEGPRELHRERFNAGFDAGSSWIDSYRREIGKISGVMFREKPWAKPLWDEMEKAEPATYDILPEYSGADIRGLLERNGRWHREFTGTQSEIYPNRYAEEFVLSAVSSYKEWLKMR